MRIWVDLLDSNSARVGSGPITTVLEWNGGGKLNESAQFSFTVPAGEPKLADLTVKMFVRCFCAVDIVTTGTEAVDSFISVPVIRELGGGVVESISTEINPNGESVVRIEGMDWLYLLNRVTTLEWQVDLPFATFVDEALPDGWTFQFVNQADENLVPLDQTQIYLEFNGVTVLNALINVCKKEGAYFRLTGFKNIEIFKDWRPARVRAIDSAYGVYDEEAPEICIIDKLTVNDDGHDIVNAVYGYGGDWLGEHYSLSRMFAYQAQTPETTVTGDPDEPPVEQETRHGATVYYVADPDSVAAYGRHETKRSWGNIHPQDEDTYEAHIKASYQLKRAVMSYLERYKEPKKAYTLDVGKLDLPVELGEQVRILYRDVRDGRVVRNIDDTLPIYGLDERVDRNGIRITSINVSSDGYEPADENEAIASTIEEGQADDPTVNSPPTDGGDNITIINDGGNQTYHNWNVIRRVPHTEYTKPGSLPNRLDADANGARTDEIAKQSVIFAEDHYNSTPDQPTLFRLSLTITGYNAADNGNRSVGAEMSFNWDHDPDAQGNQGLLPRDWVQVRVKDDTVATGWSPWRKLAWLDEVPGQNPDVRLSMETIAEMPASLTGTSGRYLAANSTASALRMAPVLHTDTVRGGEELNVPDQHYLAFRTALRIEPDAGIVVDPGGSLASEVGGNAVKLAQTAASLTPQVTEPGQVAFSIDGVTVVMVTPLTDHGGWLVDDATGALLIVDTA